jgi:hypothetical protein
MHMEAALLSAISALVGALIGGASSSVWLVAGVTATVWFNPRPGRVSNEE